METFDLVNIAIIVALAAGVALCAFLHDRALRKALAPVTRGHPRGSGRWRL